MTWTVASEPETRVRGVDDRATDISSVTTRPKYRVWGLESDPMEIYQRELKRALIVATELAGVYDMKDYLLTGDAVDTRKGHTEMSATLEAGRPQWWDRFETRLEGLRQLAHNWNGYGAEPLAPEALDKAAELLAAVCNIHTTEPSVVPASKGGVQFEWHTLAGDLEIEVLPDGLMSVLYVDANGMEIEPDHASTPLLKAFLARL
jgi:hypothetical protein